jgi:anti-sigma factor RsiW
MGEIAFVDTLGTPVLLCVIADGGADTPNHSEKRGELALTSWSRGGRGYLLIGRLPEDQVAGLAETLKVRFDVIRARIAIVASARPRSIE